MKTETAEKWNKFFEIVWVTWLISVPLIVYAVLLIGKNFTMANILFVWCLSIAVKYVLDIGPNIY
jgi:uncharacterized membrane-anchored protein YitT (DUF2179 family)